MFNFNAPFAVVYIFSYITYGAGKIAPSIHRASMYSIALKPPFVNKILLDNIYAGNICAIISNRKIF